jgi:tetratricopeptide (TPR) repeat protein
MSLLPATISAVPIKDYGIAHVELAAEETDGYFPCCGKNICRGCVHSCRQSGNRKCPFCNSDRSSKTLEEQVEDLMKRVEANDATSICLLAYCCYKGLNGFQQDHLKAIEQYTRAAELGFSKAHINLAEIYHEGGDKKKARFHYEAAAMAGNEVARCIVGIHEYNSGNIERAVKHWTIAASAGEYDAMNYLRTSFEEGYVSRESIDSTLGAYNNSCVEMRSEARDTFIRVITERN